MKQNGVAIAFVIEERRLEKKTFVKDFFKYTAGPCPTKDKLCPRKE